MNSINLPNNSPVRDFFIDVTKSFAEHSGQDEIIRAHLPENHGGHGLHSQINLINRENENCFKIRFEK